MTWGLKQTCLLDIHDNTFEGAPLEPFPIWSQYSTYRYSCGHLRTHCLELFGKKRCGQDWLESKTGWNPGLDRVQTDRAKYLWVLQQPTSYASHQPSAHTADTRNVLCLLPIRLQSASQNSSRSNCSILFHVLVSEASSSQSLLCGLALINL